MRLLMQEIHAPCIYEDLPEDDLCQTSHCSLVVQVLRDALRNCVILRDSEGFLGKQTYEALKGWPPTPRKYVQDLLKQLDRKHRLVPVSLAPGETSAPLPNDCRLALELANQTDADAVIFSGECSICSHDGKHRVCLQAYPMSSFCSNREEHERIELSANEWPVRKFESEVWRPLFQYSRRVHIVDRHLGRSIVFSGTGTNVKPEFENSVIWIASQFVQSTTREHPNVEVSCSIRRDEVTPRQQRSAVAELKKFGQRLENTIGCPVKINVKLEMSQSRSMPHARFVFADQMYLQVDPGIDLLTPSGAMKPLIISLHRDRGKVEGDVYRLPNA